MTTYVVKSVEDECEDYYDCMQEYIDEYGKHFNLKLCDFAVNHMSTKDSNGNIIKLPIWTRSKVDSLLEKYDVHIEDNHLYDYIFVANMCAADYLGSSVPDEYHLCLYIKDTIDDVDGEVGTVFCRWYSDMKLKGIEIDWKEML